MFIKQSDKYKLKVKTVHLCRFCKFYIISKAVYIFHWIMRDAQLFLPLKCLIHKWYGPYLPFLLSGRVPPPFGQYHVFLYGTMHVYELFACEEELPRVESTAL